MLLKKILVALDQSSQSQAVFDVALELAQKEGSSLMLFHCVSGDVEGSSTPFIGTLADVDMYGTMQRLQRERVQQERENAINWLQGYCDLAMSKGIPTEFDCQTGDVNSKICELAQTWGADLIIIGRRGHKGFKEILLGSVSNHVVHHAHCSVFVVQGMTPETVENLVTGSQEKTT
jgi:nucleotide-binding universal stress UspA family protein